MKLYVCVYEHGAQWRRGMGGQSPLFAPPLNFGLSETCRENFLFVGKCVQHENLGRETNIFGKFCGKIEILSTHNLLCRKFAAVYRKIATSCPTSLKPTTTLIGPVYLFMDHPVQ